MKTSDLRKYLVENVPGFTNLSIEVESTAYHYTRHSTGIIRSGRFLGAPINSGLIATSPTVVSLPATDPNGVIFAYPTAKKAAQMGFDQDVFCIRFRTAISAFHSAERELERKAGVIDSRTVLILATEIESFELLGAAKDLLAI